jgi:glycosyltransferase involved in cell wall biosynthesis
MSAKVSLVSTVRNAAPHIEEFLASVHAQTRPPDEIVIVDGGSTDGTVEILREASGVTFIEEPGSNIARGRNVAIRAATHDLIALSDADCVLEPLWLSRLLEALEEGADVAMGFYAPLTETFLQECMSAVNLPDPEELREDRFMPSGRSVAFRRTAIDAAEGYPEWLDIGEDMYVDHRWRELGMDMRLVPDAVARWRLREGPTETWRQYYRYARGDAIAGMHARRNALRFAVYAGAAAVLLSSRRAPRLAAASAGTAYATKPLRRAFERIPGLPEKAAAIVAVPALMAFTDAAKMCGYLAGLTRRLSGSRRHGSR